MPSESKHNDTKSLEELLEASKIKKEALKKIIGKINSYINKSKQS
ncbi:hypothetical protein [Psychroserpens sp. SPM9]|nr:hypothetical protein [Psychroserpens sp. SPM9]MDG5490719.1 hypothetical protein [Psychroserpens sp. SPM9]